MARSVVHGCLGLLLFPLALVPASCGGGETQAGSSGSGAAGSGAAAGAGVGGAGGSGGAVAGSGGSGGNTESTSSGTGGMPVETELVHRVGRFDETDPARPKASWSGTLYRTRVSGSGLSIKLGGATGVIFQVEVDGKVTGKVQTTGGDKSYEVASGLAAGEHEIVVERRNEGFFGDVDFLGFEPAQGATLVKTPWPYVHRLELIGDSLTAGYGIEGDSANCKFSAATESFYGTYGAVAGRNVGAAVHGIAYSGKGVFQNYAGDKNELMPVLWLRTLTNDKTSKWDFSKFTPDAVVLNLGTNDFSAAIKESDFVGAYVAFLGKIRATYPKAMIFCVTWAHWGMTHEGWVQEAMTKTGDPNLRHVGFSIDPADGLGCDGHTNLVTNQKLGAKLTQALQTELGW